eukprot:COSAG01_NODE_773_length_13704_cov_9.386843_4_plen_113_part_00
MVVVGLLAAAAAAAATQPAPPTQHHALAVISLLEPGSQTATLTTRAGTVTRSAEPLFSQDRVWEPRLDNGYPNVVFDASDPHGPWRLWYGGCSNAGNCARQYVMYANSSDGL